MIIKKRAIIVRIIDKVLKSIEKAGIILCFSSDK